MYAGVIVATSGEASTYYVQIQSQILAQYGSGAWTYILPDHLGSVRQLTNASGQVTLAQSYDPFGNLFEAAGLGASGFGYTGEWWDAEAELLHLRARYYDPAVGRLLSKDPWPGNVSWPQSLNGWSHVAGNPINATDPSGYLVIPLLRICIFGVDPETGDCEDALGIPPVFATTMAVDPASGTAQVALTVLTYLALGLIDDLEVSPPPIQVGNPWEGLREWIPAEQQPAPHILEPPLGDTTEWLPPRLPGPSLDDVPSTLHILDFTLVQPCFDDYILLSTGGQYKIYVVRDRKTNEVIYVGKTKRDFSVREREHRSIFGRENWKLERAKTDLSYTEARYWEQKLMDQYGEVELLENKIRAVAPRKWQKIKDMFE
jgi:RHS repeat-associated protein